jgi:RAT1-interacting protein
VTFFSFDEEHKFRLDESSLRYYYPPNLSDGLDLSHGFDTFRQLDDTNDDHLDGLLEALAAHEQGKGTKVETDFITWRGMMTKV